MFTIELKFSSMILFRYSSASSSSSFIEYSPNVILSRFSTIDMFNATALTLCCLPSACSVRNVLMFSSFISLTICLTFSV